MLQGRRPCPRDDTPNRHLLRSDYALLTRQGEHPSFDGRPTLIGTFGTAGYRNDSRALFAFPGDLSQWKAELLRRSGSRSYSPVANNHSISSYRGEKI
jgi:hypothetical protein